MHHRDGAVLTASKDGSVAVTNVTPCGALQPGHRFLERHDGVAKCVRYCPAKQHTFASCGNDR